MKIGFKIGSILIGVLITFSCIEHRPKEESIKTENTDSGDITPTKVKYDLVRIYEGKIPCADCSGIEQHLVMKGDSMGIYRLTETYKDATEDGDAVLISTGHWKDTMFTKTGKNYIYFSEGGLKDSTRVMQFVYSKSAINLTKLNEEVIDAPTKYALHLERTMHYD